VNECVLVYWVCVWVYVYSHLLTNPLTPHSLTLTHTHLLTLTHTHLLTHSLTHSLTYTHTHTSTDDPILPQIADLGMKYFQLIDQPVHITKRYRVTVQ
jgi:hypothetical protein